jgi:hypothetical protein
MGWVYIAKNPSIPNLIKIGMTDRDDPHTRIEELNTTGLPEPFRIEFALRVSDAVSVEGALHARYSDFRVSMNREFFKLDSSHVLRDLDSVIIELGIENHQLQIFNPDLSSAQPSFESNPRWGSVELQEGLLSKDILQEFLRNYISEHLWFVPPEILEESLLIAELIGSNRLRYIQRSDTEDIFNRARAERFNTLIHLLLPPPAIEYPQGGLGITQPISLPSGIIISTFIEDLDKARKSKHVAMLPDYVPTKGVMEDPSLPANQELREEYSIKIQEDLLVSFFNDLSLEILDSSSNVSFQHRMYLYLRYEQKIFTNRKFILSIRDYFLQTDQKTLGFYLSGDVILCETENLSWDNEIKIVKRSEVLATYMSIYDASFLIFFEATLESGVSENDIAKFCRKLVNERSLIITNEHDANNFLLLLSRITNYCLQRHDGYTDDEPFFDVSVIPRTLRKFVSSDEMSAIYKTAHSGNYSPFTEQARWKQIISLTEGKSNFRSGLNFSLVHSR